MIGRVYESQNPPTTHQLVSPLLGGRNPSTVHCPRFLGSEGFHEIKVLQPEFCRDALRRKFVRHGGPVLHVDASSAPRTTHRVWDQAATIDFIKPGTGRVTATFTLDLEEIERLRHISLDGKAHRPIYTVDIIDETGALVARAHKTLYIRQKSRSE